VLERAVETTEEEGGFEVEGEKVELERGVEVETEVAVLTTLPMSTQGSY
jgi:hypothetical protein